MYLTFYNLTREPFDITPDPEFLFLSPSHKEALASIIYGIEQRKGFVEITGGVGLGKTTVLRSYLDGTDREKLKIVYVFNANVSFENLLKTIYQELDLATETDDPFMMVNKLHQIFIDEYRQGHNVILVVDEAQNMPVSTLENLRMLSNLETASDKLIQIVLVGQPELDEVLKSYQLRQLRQRIAVRAVICPLTREESLSYLAHRLSKAGMTDTPVFTDRALQLIARHAQGVPRVMNILSDNALITGFGYQARPVTVRIVKEIIADLEGKKRTPILTWCAVTGSALILIAVGYFFVRPYVIPLLRTPEQAAPKAAVLIDTRKADRVTAPAAVKPVPPSVPVAVTAATPKEPGPVTVVVKKGDSLTKLVKDVYGSMDENALETVKRHNPRIKDVNVIMVDEEIIFPQAPQAEKVGR
jgi:general secretion pathway protein A